MARIHNQNVNADMLLFFSLHSLQANEVIRAGKGVSGRPGLDPELYEAHQREMPASEFAIPPALKPYILAFVAAVNVLS